jgi:hypothetical protein
MAAACIKMRIMAQNHKDVKSCKVFRVPGKFNDVVGAEDHAVGSMSAGYGNEVTIGGTR